MTRKKLYAIIITAILVAAIIAGIYYWMSTRGPPEEEEEGPPPVSTIANITGTVTDEAGNRIEGAIMERYELAPGAAPRIIDFATTDSDGVYLFPGVFYATPTNYSIKVEKAGYDTETSTVCVDEAKQYTVNFVLKPSVTSVYLEPSEIILNTVDVSVGYRFTVTAMVSDVTDLFGFQVALYYDASVINVASASLPADHVLAGPGMPAAPRYEYFDSWGVCFIGFSGLKGETTPVSGDGKLAEFEIEIIASPPEGGSLTSDLIISTKISPYPYETKLYDPAGLPMGFTATDGYYEYVG